MVGGDGRAELTGSWSIRVNREAPERFGSAAQETAHLEDAWFASLVALE